MRKNYTEGKRGAKGYGEKNKNLPKYKKGKDEEQKNKDGLNAPDIYPQLSEENQNMNDANYYPIHDLKKNGNLGGEGEMGRREENNQGVNPEDADIYRFYESRKL